MGERNAESWRQRLLARDIQPTHEVPPPDEEIKRRYIELPDEDVKLHCSYTTRLEGFLDILLSGSILSSHEAEMLLGSVHTHRGGSLGGSRSGGKNDDISLSTGFVSFKYSDATIRSRDEYIGGCGFFIPLETVLEHQKIGFSHTSRKGGIKNYALNKENIDTAVHLARRFGELFDDGYGNVFEVKYEPMHDEQDTSSSFKKILEYPRIAVSIGILAIPEAMKPVIEQLLVERQKMYQQLFDQIRALPEEDRDKPQTFGDRDILFPQKTLEMLQTMLSASTNIEELRIFWYSQKNLDMALQYVSMMK